MKKITTKKMPVSLSFGDFETKKNEFLVPFSFGTESDFNKNSFLGMKSGKEFPYGAVSYIGKEISAEDIFEKMIHSKIHLKNKSESIILINIFIEKLQDFKIGNVLKIEILKDGDFNLIKVADRPPRKKVSRIP